MSVKVGINGFGRIGRQVLRIGLERNDLEFVAVNDITDTKTLAHLFKYDSVFGTFNGEIKVEDNTMIVNGNPVKIFSEREPANIPWSDQGVDVVVESSGIFRTREQASAHLGETVKKVAITAPAKGGADFTTVLGVNDHIYDPENHHVVSNASCTTNCFAMVVKVLHENFTIRKGQMSTVHSYTNDQKILDAPHKDLRRARAAAMSMIPTSTGAANVIQVIFPELKGKLHALAVRVPTPDVSLVDFTCEVGKNTTINEVNETFRQYAENNLKGYLNYLDEELVSTDLIGDTHSASLDSKLTSVIDGNLVKVIAWYDNEYGYSARVVDLVELMGGRK